MGLRVLPLCSIPATSTWNPFLSNQALYCHRRIWRISYCAKWNDTKRVRVPVSCSVTWHRFRRVPTVPLFAPSLFWCFRCSSLSTKCVKLVAVLLRLIFIVLQLQICPAKSTAFSLEPITEQRPFIFSCIISIKMHLNLTFNYVSNRKMFLL